MDISILSNQTIIKAAKNQLVSKGTDKVKKTIISKADELNNELEQITSKKKELNRNYNDSLLLINKDNTASNEEKDKQIESLRTNYEKELGLLDEQSEKLKQNIKDIDNDILKEAKANTKKVNNSINDKVKSSKANLSKSNTLRIKQVLKNNKKSLVPIIINQLTSILVKIINQNEKIVELIDKTNELIDNADTIKKVEPALLMRNETLTVINNQEKKILNVQDTLKTVSTIIQIFSVIVTILSALPVPVSVPPGVGIPLNVITKITKTIEKLTKLVEELSTVLAIMIPLTEEMVNELERLKLELHNISDILDDKTKESINIYNNIVSNFNILSSSNYDEYKGFKFALKEDENLGAHESVSFRNIKRHYAVAINKDGVEVLKSEYSFTLDPNDLIEQLKIQIDKLNLQA